MKIINKSLNLKIVFGIVFYFLIFFIFFSTTINSLSWIKFNFLMDFFKEYHDEICFLLGFIIAFGELVSLIKSIFSKDWKTTFESIFGFFCIPLVYYATLKKMYAIYVLIVFVARRYKFNTLINIYFYAKLVSFIIWVIAFVFNMIEIPLFDDGYSFGLYHYNDTALNLSCLFYATWYKYLQEKKILSTGIAILLAIIFVYPIQSRTPVLVLIGFIVLIWLKSLFENLRLKTPFLYKLFITCYPLLMALVTLFMCCLIYKVGRFVEDPFISRFYEGIITYQKIGLPLTCRPFNLDSLPFVYDNMYVRFLFRYGLITLIIVIDGLCLVGKKVYNYKDWGMFVLLIVTCTYAQMEFILKGELLLIVLMYLLSIPMQKND